MTHNRGSRLQWWGLVWVLVACAFFYLMRGNPFRELAAVVVVVGWTVLYLLYGVIRVLGRDVQKLREQNERIDGKLDAILAELERARAAS